MRSLVPGATGGTSTTTAPDNSPGLMQMLLGGGLLASRFMSDDDTKTNKQKVGVDKETGLTLYAYDYISDVEKAKRDGTAMPPKRVGPMASEVEKKFPGSTHLVGGKRIVDGGLLGERASERERPSSDVTLLGRKAA
jgi:hypothetical protein